MGIFLNSGEKELSAGQDILEVRRLDQSLEFQWVAGFTTISQRAQYLSLMPWLLAALHQQAFRSGQDDGALDDAASSAAFSGMEEVALAATPEGQRTGSTLPAGLLLWQGAAGFCVTTQKAPARQCHNVNILFQYHLDEGSFQPPFLCPVEALQERGCPPRSSW